MELQQNYNFEKVTWFLLYEGRDQRDQTPLGYRRNRLAVPQPIEWQSIGDEIKATMIRL